MNFDFSKRLIVVYCDKTKKYANYLQQLIASKDDTIGDDGEENVIGLKDRTVDCVIWSKKQYDDNLATMSAHNYVLFLDYKNSFEDETCFMIEAFSKFGMHFKYLGTKGALSIDDIALNAREYDEFVEYCKELINIVGAKQIEKHEKLKFDMSVKAKAVVAVASLLTPLAAAVPIAVSAIGNQIGNKIKENKVSKDIQDQQYTCLVLTLYLKGLKAFLDLED